MSAMITEQMQHSINAKPARMGMLPRLKCLVLIQCSHIALRLRSGQAQTSEEEQVRFRRVVPIDQFSGTAVSLLIPTKRANAPRLLQHTIVKAQDK